MCPETGQTEALISPFVNKDAMKQHLQQISEVTEPGRHALVIMDGAGWHTDDIAYGIDNLTIIKLPPDSPELNPIEQVWSWLRQHYLANRCFANYEDIIEACSESWNGFIRNVENVKTLCWRDWIKLTT